MKEVLLERVLDALWEHQWTTKWAAENTVCAYGCLSVPYEDQKAHHPDCEFVKLWSDLENVRRRVHEKREPDVEIGLGPRTPVGRT